MEKNIVSAAFLRCQAYDKKVRWTFFSYASKEPKLVLQ